MRALFIHGGPGLNSIAEKELLTEPAIAKSISIDFWNEPRDLTKYDNRSAYLNWCKSVKLALDRVPKSEPVHFIAHSFGAHAALECMSEYEDKISELTLITPATSAFEVQKSILALAAADFAKHGDDKAGLIHDIIEQANSPMDDHIRMGLELAFTDSELFSNYWVNKKAESQWNEILVSRNAFINLESFWQVLATLSLDYQSIDNISRCSIPINVVFGRKDPIIQSDKEKEIISRFSSRTQYMEFENSGHFPHLEETARFFNTLF